MIKTFDYLRLLPEHEEEVIEALRRVLRSGALILGPETSAFEDEFAAHLGVKHCIAVTSGTTALHLALNAMGIGPGDEVITVANTCPPTVAAIRLAGATPVFADVREDDFMMDPECVESAITEKTRCILPVHLWGMAADMDWILAIAERHGLEVLEDCAQSLGTLCNDRPTGRFGRAACFSFYPTKNLGAYGDGGAVVTDDSELAARLRRKRMYGYDGSPVSIEEGMNARIAEMQSAILRIKLRRFPEWLDRRLAIADLYNISIANPALTMPVSSPARRPSYHQYVVRCPERERLIDHLNRREIGFGIHYPEPIHTMPAYKPLVPEAVALPVTERCCREVLSIPVHEALTDAEVQSVIAALNEFPSAT